MSNEQRATLEREQTEQLIGFLRGAGELIDAACTTNAAGDFLHAGQTRRKCVIALGLVIEVLSVLEGAR
jgi:hypothetical protein